MRKMNESEMRDIVGGNYHCNYCGYSTWGNGNSGMPYHILTYHTAYGRYGVKSHFHWSGSYNCFYKCSKVTNYMKH